MDAQIITTSTMDTRTDGIKTTGNFENPSSPSSPLLGTPISAARNTKIINQPITRIKSSKSPMPPPSISGFQCVSISTTIVINKDKTDAILIAKINLYFLYILSSSIHFTIWTINHIVPSSDARKSKIISIIFYLIVVLSLRGQ